MVIKVLKENMRIRLASIPTCSTNLLEITFHRPWDIVMDDGFDVRLIDSHSKGNCGDEDLDFLIHEVLLDFKSSFLR